MVTHLLCFFFFFYFYTRPIGYLGYIYKYCMVKLSFSSLCIEASPEASLFHFFFPCLDKESAPFFGGSLDFFSLPSSL